MTKSNSMSEFINMKEEYNMFEVDFNKAEEEK